MNDRRPIKEQVLEALQHHSHTGNFTIGAIAQETGLTRRQVTTALHSLADYGLEDQIERVGKGIWKYTPIGTRPSPMSQPSTGQYRWPDELPTEVPVGWRIAATVLSRRRTPSGWTYTAITDTGALFTLEPIYEVQTAEQEDL